MGELGKTVSEGSSGWIASFFRTADTHNEIDELKGGTDRQRQSSSKLKNKHVPIVLSESSNMR